MPIDQDALELLEHMAAKEKIPLHTLSPNEARQNDMLPLRPGPQVFSVEDRVIPAHATQVPVRIYTPAEGGPFPVLVWFHGGGWVLGDLEMEDATCRRLAVGADCVVVSVDYRLAPEAKFPAAVEDCYKATMWALENAAQINGDSRLVAVGGDSAGGNLAAAVALMTRDLMGPSLAFQLMVCPITDHAFDTSSYRECGNRFRPERDLMIWFWNHYLDTESDADNPYASPLRAQDLSGLPPAHIITAEFDPLRDEGEAYAERLKLAGVPTSHKRYDGTIHFLFLLSDELEKGKQAVADASAVLRQAFHAPPAAT